MKKLTAEQIVKLKQRARHVEYSNVSFDEVPELETRSAALLDKRQVEGYAIIWGKRNLFGEKFVKGSWAKSIQERGPGSSSKYKIKMLWQHRDDDPLGLFEEIRETDIGLYFRTVPLDDVPSADRVLQQIRSGTINNFSAGFNFVWDKIEYDEEDNSYVLMEVEGYEISPVSIPADMGTYAIRNINDRMQLESLYDEVEDFIGLLPKKDRLQARNLFARHKALIEAEEPEGQAQPLETRSEPLGSLDYELVGNLFINNFKL